MASPETPITGKMIELVELNLGNWKPLAVVIFDINQKIWNQKGKILPEVFNYYKKFPLAEMHVGDSIHNNNTFLMKVTEKTGVIVEMESLHVARLAAINLRGRINALSEFYKLEEFIQEDKETTKFKDAAKSEKRMW
nr:hypothetical protein [Candidatus Freyarchaeota archaeon]